ncbi:MAG: DUF4870 domain-containing protein [Anaerolineae bacterium]
MSEKVIERPPGLKPETTSEERTWAALAHGSTVLTVLATILSGGIAGLVLPFVPLGSYLIYKDKSRYVAEQALQAFVVQVAVTLGYVLLVVVAALTIVLAWVITGVLIIILVGLLLIPVALLVTIVLGLALVVYPFVVAGLSIAATVEVANGKDYRIPYIGSRVVSWVHSTKGPKANDLPPPV